MKEKLLLGGLIFAVLFTAGCTAVDKLPQVTSPNPIVCNSSDPAKINVKAHSIGSAGTSGSSFGEVVLTNLTGGELSSVSCTGSNAFASSVPGCPSTVSSGADVRLKPNAGSPGRHVDNEIDISYRDYAGLQRSAKITCFGLITIS